MSECGVESAIDDGHDLPGTAMRVGFRSQLVRGSGANEMDNETQGDDVDDGAASTASPHSWTTPSYGEVVDQVHQLLHGRFGELAI